MALLGVVESSVKYHSVNVQILTCMGETHEEQCVAGSFTGAVPSQKVTEGFKGRLGANGNRADSARA